MASATGTNDNANKRTRFDPSASIGVSSERQPPKALALSFIQQHTASLQRDLKATLDFLGKQHTELLHNAYQLQRQIKRFTDNNDVIPNSAKVEFTLKASKKAEFWLDIFLLHSKGCLKG
mmetsp:Transcript_18968/g.26128  ORF Transcript_18968/g.26128 Transcript_18968/m.26128 type:complete len:120 (-) Transcript_18968:1034-1393(-)